MARGKGPQNGIAHLARYIAEEQKLGRLAKDLDGKAVPTALLSAFFFQAFSSALLDAAPPGASARRMVTSVLRSGHE